MNLEVIKGSLRPNYGVGIFEDETIVGIRIPKKSILEIDEDDILEIQKKRDILAEYLRREISAVYIMGENSYVALPPDKFADYILSDMPDVEIEWDSEGVRVGTFDGSFRGLDVMLLEGGGVGGDGTGGGAGGEGLGYGGGRGGGGGGRGSGGKIVIKTGVEIDVRKIQNIMSQLTKSRRKVVSGFVKSGRRTSVITTGKRGRYVRYRDPVGDRKNVDLALVPTIREAAQKGHRDPRTGRILIEVDDFKEKVRRRKISSMLCLVYDASGSINTTERKEIVKQVIQALLLDAYQKRDRIALITYAGDKASLVMPFTSSVESAKKFLENIQFGGATPLASGMLMGLNLLIRERVKMPEVTPILVIFSDGTANVPISFGSNVELELFRVAQLIRNSGMRTLFIDVNPEGSPLVLKLADVADGAYYNPSGLDKRKIYEIIAAEREEVKFGKRRFNPQSIASRVIS